jgi:hypothetical protein
MHAVPPWKRACLHVSRRSPPMRHSTGSMWKKVSQHVAHAVHWPAHAVHWPAHAVHWPAHAVHYWSLTWPDYEQWCDWGYWKGKQAVEETKKQLWLLRKPRNTYYWCRQLWGTPLLHTSTVNISCALQNHVNRHWCHLSRVPWEWHDYQCVGPHSMCWGGNCLEI